MHSKIEMPSRMLNLKLAHKVSKHEYNLTVYYAPQVKTINKTEMVNIVKIFSQVHLRSSESVVVATGSLIQVSSIKMPILKWFGKL